MLNVLSLLLALNAAPADLAFLAGHWQEDRPGPKGTAVFEEHWLAPRAGLMLGLSRAARGEGEAARALGFEFLRIEFRGADEVVYLAQPQGRPATEFRLTELQPGQSVRFENPQHERVRSIRYRLEADGSLSAEIEGGAGSQRWRFLRR